MASVWPCLSSIPGAQSQARRENTRFKLQLPEQWAESAALGMGTGPGSLRSLVRKLHLHPTFRARLFTP